MSNRTIKENYETIRKLCERYRGELTVFSGVIGEYTGMCDYYEYVEFMNQLPFDVFVGNFLNCLLIDEHCESYEQILNGEKTFIEEIVGDTIYGDKIVELFKEKIES